MEWHSHLRFFRRASFLLLLGEALVSISSSRRVRHVSINRMVAPTQNATDVLPWRVFKKFLGNSSSVEAAESEAASEAKSSADVAALTELNLTQGIQATRAEDASELKVSVDAAARDFIMPWVPTIEELIAYAFAVICVLYFTTVFLTHIPSRKNVKVMRKMLESMRDGYEAVVSELVKSAAEASMLAAAQTERIFQEKRQSFGDFLGTVLQTEKFNEPGKLVEPFRDVVALWLLVYEQCFVEPEEDPSLTVLFEESKAQKRAGMRTSFEKRKTPAEIAENTLEQYLPTKPANLLSDLEKVTKMKREVDRGAKRKFWIGGRKAVSCDIATGLTESIMPMDVFVCCLTVRVYSYQHIAQMVAVVFGVALALLLHVEGWLLPALAVDAAVILLLVLLFFVDAIDERDTLRKEIQRLEAERLKAQDLQKRINTQQSRMQRVMSLWTHQTIPALKLLGEMQETILDKFLQQHTSTDADHLGQIMKRLLARQEGLGRKELWFGAQARPEHKLAAAAREVEAATRFIAEQKEEERALVQILEYLKKPAGFLTVHVRAAHDLPSEDGSAIDPFVVVRTAKLAPRTRTFQGTANPEWAHDDQDEILIDVDFEESSFMMELRDARDPKQEILAFLPVKFREQQGQLQRRLQVPLLGAKTKEPGSHGSIDFDFHYVSVEQWCRPCS